MTKSPASIQFLGKLGSNPVFLKMASTHMALLTGAIDDVLERSVAKLTELASDPGPERDGTPYMDTAVQLRRHGAEVRNRFLGMAGRALREYCMRDPWAQREEGERAVERWQDMRVLDDSDVAETLAAEAAIQRAEQRYTQDLHCLQLRMAELAGFESSEQDENPLGPDQLISALREALRDLIDELAGRLEIIDVFDRALLRRLEDLYDPINELLARAGILPDIRWEPRLKRLRDRPAPAANDDEAAAKDEAGTAAADDAGAGDRTADGDTADRSVRRGYLDGWLFGSIQWLLSQRRRVRGDTRDESTPGIATEVLGQALDGMQAEAARHETAAFRTLDALKADLMDNASALAGPDAPRQLTLADENVLDSVGMMFGFMGSDSQLPAPFQAALGKLQIPYLKAALHDPSLLSEAESPAKLLLNEMADAGLGWNEESDTGGRILKKVQFIADRILSDYRDNPALFDDLLEEFHGFKRRYQRRAEVLARREVEAAAGRERLQVARREVGAFIVEQTRDRELPPLIGDLLRKSWAHVMVLTMLTHGRQSAQWKQAIAVTRELIWSVTFRPEPAGVKRLRSRLPALARTLLAGLKKVGYSESELEKLKYRLKRLYSDLISQTGSDRIVIEASAEGLVIHGEDLTDLDESELAELPVVDDDGELGVVLDSVRTWRPGQWVMFHRQGDKPLRAKLSWVSPITGRYLFVNQRGAKALERSAAELVEDVIGERLEVLDTEEMVSRAMSAVASSLQEGLTEAA